MARRCKAGQRARIVNSADEGKIVLILRPYFGEVVEGARWPSAVFPWVVVSLGELLGAVHVETGEDAGPHRVMVYDDCDLEPIDDDDDGNSTETDTDRPVCKSTRAPKVVPRRRKAVREIEAQP